MDIKILIPRGMCYPLNVFCLFDFVAALPFFFPGGNKICFLSTDTQFGFEYFILMKGDAVGKIIKFSRY